MEGFTYVSTPEDRATAGLIVEEAEKLLDGSADATALQAAETRLDGAIEFLEGKVDGAAKQVIIPALRVKGQYRLKLGDSPQAEQLFIEALTLSSRYGQDEAEALRILELAAELPGFKKALEDLALLSAALPSGS